MPSVMLKKNAEGKLVSTYPKKIWKKWRNPLNGNRQLKHTYSSL